MVITYILNTPPQPNVNLIKNLLQEKPIGTKT